MLKPVSIKSSKPCVCPVDLHMYRTDGSKSSDNFRCTSYYHSWSNMFIGVGKSDVRTDGRSVRAETAAINMKGDTQRTAAGSKNTAICTSQKNRISTKRSRCAGTVQHFVPQTHTRPQNVLTMTPWRYIKVMEVRLHLFYTWKLSEVINCLKPPHATAV